MPEQIAPSQGEFLVRPSGGTAERSVPSSAGSAVRLWPTPEKPPCIQQRATGITVGAGWCVLPGRRRWGRISDKPVHPRVVEVAGQAALAETARPKSGTHGRSLGSGSARGGTAESRDRASLAHGRYEVDSQAHD